MNIENLVRLTDAVLLTKPSIKSVNDYVFNCDKVHQGNAYMAVDRDSDSVEIAVKNGAYAIFYDFDMEVSDDEIAWIKVDSLEVAMMRLMRFISSYKKLNFVAVSELQKSILEKLKLAENSSILETNLSEVFRKVMVAKDNDYLFTSSENILQKVGPLHESVWTDRQVNALSQSTLFQSSFIHRDIYYKEIPLSPMFLQAFGGVVNFLEDKKISYQVQPFKPIKHFEPLFVDKSLNIMPFGATAQALIIENDEKIFEQEIKYINKNYSHINFAFIKPKDVKIRTQTNFEYNDYDELVELLEPKKYRYILILGDKNEIENAIEKKLSLKKATLF